MAKLYPPYIEGTIPAFYVNGSSATLTVPFSMNKAVSLTDFSGIAIKIKTVQSNEYIYSAVSAVSDIYYIRDSLKVNFTIDLSSNEKFKVGQFYKVQIAYCDTSLLRTPGYYSTVGVVKLTSKPKVTIADLDNLSAHRVTYTGVYSQQATDDEDRDVSEKVYEYCFNLYEVIDNSEPVLVASSDWQLHNSSTDILSYESSDDYSFTYSLKQNKYYQVEYIVRTINGLEISSGRYTVMDKVGIAPELNAQFTYNINFDNGYIDLYFIPNDLEHNYTNGTFLLTRASNEDNYTNWYELKRFSLRNADKLNEWHFKDFTVQHGQQYCYSIQQYNSKGLYSTRLYATKNNNRYIQADFEDCFLYDGQYQLKIRFNPKVSSFKTDLMENKVDTIGSKYPFIFRNSKVEYKEFPIAGLISYHSDEENLFVSDEDLGLTTNYSSQPRSVISRTKAYNDDELKLKPRTTSLETYNITAERIFKLRVLDWLNNGQPKLFRSPTEGNYFVRLMNVSLTPEEKTGRMIHNFQATAYEIANCSYATLNQFNLITIDEPAEQQYRLETVDLSTAETKAYYANSAWGADQIATQISKLNTLVEVQQEELTVLYNNVAAARNAYLAGVGTQDEQYLFKQLQTAYDTANAKEFEILGLNEEIIRLQGLNGYKKYNQKEISEYIEFRDCLPGTTFYIFDQTAGEEFSITIGVTGSYTVYVKDHIFTSIRVSDEDGEPAFGLITYKYLAVLENRFEKIYNIDFEQTVARQFIGPCEIINTNKDYDLINDIKRTLIAFYYTNFAAKDIEVIYEDRTSDPTTYWQWDENGSSFNEKKGILISSDTFSPLNIYKIYYTVDSYEYALWQYNPATAVYDWVTINKIDYSIMIDDNIIELEPHHEEELLNHLIQFFNDQTFTYLKIGNGIVLDGAYTSSLVTYNVESTDTELIEKMNTYTLAAEQYYNSANGQTYLSPQYYQNTLYPLWREYCDLLKTKL